MKNGTVLQKGAVRNLIKEGNSWSLTRNRRLASDCLQVFPPSEFT